MHHQQLKRNADAQSMLHIQLLDATVDREMFIAGPQPGVDGRALPKP